MLRLLTLVGAVTLVAQTVAEEGVHFQSPYAGEQTRRIKSLSPDDIAQLEAGQGWGLAKAAELNGMPGPIHVLEMKTQIGLEADQEAAVQAVYDRMKQQAVPLGQQLVAQEQALNDAFAGKTITRENLKTQLRAIADTRAALRYAHLQAHLATVDLLAPQQVTRYNALRGYGHADPCERVPDGHDTARWLSHHGCP